MRVAIAAVLTVAGLGLVGVAFAGTGQLSAPLQLSAVAPVEVRAWPQGGNFAAAPEAKPAEAAKPAPAEAPKPAEAAKPIPAEAAKPAEAKAAPAEAAKPAEPKPAAVPAAKPAEPKPAAVAGAAARPAPAAPAEAKPEAVAAKPAAEPAAPAAGGSTDAILQLRASDTADVFVDGKKVGQSPVLGVKVKPGKHKIRFDCYEASGATTKGPEKVIDVRALEEKDVEYECTAEAKAPSHDEAPY